MTSTVERDSRLPTVVHAETPTSAPPVLVTGPLAWVRKNLLATPTDAILTVAGLVILITLAASFLSWSITQANWFVITRNVRLFMAGTFPVEDIWRVNLVALLAAFGVGFSIYAFLRLPRLALAVLLILALILVLVPPVIHLLGQPPVSLMAVGSADIVSGTVTETPLEEVTFVGEAGQVVSFEMQPAPDVETLAASAGFTDRAALALINGARNRLAAFAEQAELEQRLAGDLLTANQRAAADSALASLTIPDSPIETYALNTAPVTLRLLDPATRQPVAEGVVVPGGPALSVTLPHSGWYILEKTLEGDSVALVRAYNTEPAIQRAVAGGDDGLGFSRVVDDFTITEARPKWDGRELPFNALTDNQWQGGRTLGQYLVIFAAPMLGSLAGGLLPMMALGIAGYSAAWALGKTIRRPAREATNPRWPARRVVPALWLVVGALAAILLIGLPGASPLMVGSLLARFVWVGWLYFTGAALDKPWGRPLFVLLMVLNLAQTLLENGVFSGAALSGSTLVSLALGFGLWFVAGVVAARQGATARRTLTSGQMVRGVLVCAIVWAALLIVPLLAAGVSSSAEPLPAVDTRRWGGLLLTSVITIVALVASFPLGILLALGRRSSLPLVRGVCTAFIELVRGVPLITVLFMAMLLVPLINPGLASVENVYRAIVGFTIFSAAYLAENVRGGLQSVPPGQEEAARALGLSGWQVILLITLPQALRAVIPALVGQCIALFKDTSLVALVGLTDLTGISKAVISQAEYVGLQSEVYVFISIIYFIFSYAMAYVSRRIEASGSGKARRL